MTKRDFLVRYAVVVLAIFLVIAAFSYRQQAEEREGWKAVVIHISANRTDPPKMVLYRFSGGNHWLITYEIDRTDQNRFTSIASRQLPAAPEQLEGDLESNGVWVKIKENWYYFNEQLKEEDRNVRYRSEEKSNSVPFHIEGRQSVITVVDEKPIRFPVNPDDQITAVYRLAMDDHLWLLLLENDVKVIEGE